MCVTSALVTAETALTVLGVALDLAAKVKQVYETGNPVSIEDEVKRLDAARLRPSEDVIADADKAAGAAK